MMIPFTFLTYYSNHSLIHQLVKGAIEDTMVRSLQEAAKFRDIIKRHCENAAYNQGIVEYLITHEVPPIQELLIKRDEGIKGKLFWAEIPFTFKGAGAAYEDVHYKGKPTSYFNFYAKFKEFNDIKLEGILNFEHMYSTTATTELSGKKRKFMLGYIQELANNVITARTVLIGDRILVSDMPIAFDNSYLKVNIEDIDEFSEAKKISHRDSSIDIQQNKNISESSTKQWFSEIIGEGDVSKDWGGEQSDLFTTHLHIDGERLRAAFILKGPSKFHKMQMKDLGKQGDQITRLFNQPADVFILQHCHYVDPSVVRTMEVFACDFRKPRRYCIIDGIDTLRILKAYHKI